MAGKYGRTGGVSVDAIESLVARYLDAASIAGIELLHTSPLSSSWKICAGDRDYVFRQDHQAAAQIGLNRASECSVLTAVAPLNLGPRLIQFDPQAGWLLREFAPGRVWSAAELVSEANLVRYARLLRAVHDADVQVPVADLAGFVRRYARLAGTAAARQHARAAETLIQRWCSDPHRLALCHVDPHCANVVEHAMTGELLLLDWEYAGLSEPCFDLAVAIHHHDLPAAAANRFIDAYGAAPDRDRLAGCLQLCRHIYELWLMAVRASG